MKKLVYSLSFVLLLSGTAQKSFAQIPNASFENWTSGNPDGWLTSNQGSSPIPGSVVESNNAHDGSHAADMVATQVGSTSYYLSSLMSSYNTATQTTLFPVSSKPGSLHGWYIGTLDNGDQVQVNAETFGQYSGSETSTGLLSDSVTETTSVYKEFSFNFTYPYPGNYTVDSADINFDLFNANTFSPHAGAHFLVDDLSFSTSTSAAVKDIKNTSVTLEQNSPNPAVSQTNIIYSLQSASKVTLNIVDVLGRTVKTVINLNQTPGRYKAIVDVNDLPAGTYFYQLNAGGSFASNMMTVAK